MTRVRRRSSPGHNVSARRLGLLLSLMLGLVACSSQPPRDAPPVMTFTLTLFDGSQRRAADLHGHTTVVNFWASWCQPCREEMPALQRVWQAYQVHGVIFVGVVLQGDDQRAARAFLREAGIAYANGQDSAGQLAAAFQVLGLPNTFILSREGRLVQRFIGPVSEARLRQRLEQALAL